jgi:hypothetical protein
VEGIILMENYQIVILFLDKNGFDLYTPTQESFLRFAFSPQAVQDMEVISTDILISQLTTFITSYSIPPSLVTILISQSLLFMQDIQTIIPSQDGNTPPQTVSAVEQQQKIQQFLDTVPFEVTESKTFPIDGGIRIAATNKALYQDIITSFEKTGSLVKAVIPTFVLGTANEGLNDETITTVIKNNEALKQESFVVHIQEIIPLTPEEKKKEFFSLPKQQKKLYVYGGAFVLLMSVLGLMVKQMFDSNTAEIQKGQQLKNSSKQITNQIAVTPTTMITQIPVGSFLPSSSAAIDRTAVKIVIETSSITSTQGTLIKNKLLTNGYTNVAVNANAPATTAKTLVIFSTTVNPTIQTEITTMISNIFTNFSTQQGTQTKFDITIIPSSTL